jgi:hypothetical protein
MVKTTVYLPEALKDRVAQLARAQGRSEADVIRAALEAFTTGSSPPRPRLGLFDSGRSDLGRRADDYLDGFGRT